MAGSFRMRRVITFAIDLKRPRGKARRSTAVASKPGDLSPASRQRLLGHPGSVDDRPVQLANVIAVLTLHDRRRGIRCVALASADPFQSGIESGLQKQSGESRIQFARDIANGDTLSFIGKHCIRHDGMALRKNPESLLLEGFVDLPGNIRPIRAFGQPVSLTDPKQLLSHDVGAQDNGSRQRCEAGRDAARQDGFSSP